MDPPRPRSGSFLLAAAALVLVPTLLLGPALFGSRALVGLPVSVLSPWRAELPAARLAALRQETAPIAGDETLSVWPLMAASLERLAHLEAPLWNPDNLGGVPLLAQATQSALHPTTWLALALPFAKAFGWMAWVQAAAAGLFALLLARELGCGPPAAFLGGLTFMLSGYLAARWHWTPITGASLYLPLGLLATERLHKGARGGATALLAAAVGGAFLSGFLQGAVHLCYAAGLWAGVRLVQGLRAGEARRRRAVRASLRCAVGLLLGVALGAPQLLPTASYVFGGESARATVSPTDLRHLAMPPAGLVGVLAPDLFGTPEQLAAHEQPLLRDASTQRRLIHKPNGNRIETACWLGVASALLALLGAASRRAGAGLGLALLLAGGLLALDTPLLEVVGRLPGLATSDPRRFLLLLSMGGALLAALGLQHVLERGPPTWLLAAGAVLVLLAGGLALGFGRLDAEDWSGMVAAPLASELTARSPPGETVTAAQVAEHADDLDLDRRILVHALDRLSLVAALALAALLLARKRRPPAVALLLGLSLVDLGTAARVDLHLLPAAGAFTAPPGLDRLSDPAGGRLLRFHPGGVADLDDVPLPPDTGLPFGVPDLLGYFALSPRRVLAVLERVEPGCTNLDAGPATLSEPAALDSPLLDRLGGGRVLSSVPLQRPGLRPLGTVGDAWLYAREHVRPRAFLGLARPVPAGPAALDELATASGDCHAGVFVEPVDGHDPTRDLPAEVLLPAGGHGPDDRCARAFASPVTIVSERPEAVELHVDAAVPGLLVLADTFASGWSATLDGHPVRIWPADHALRAVAVGAGAHEVHFRYRSRAWELALPAALAALVGVAALLLLDRPGRARA